MLSYTYYPFLSQHPSAIGYRKTLGRNSWSWEKGLVHWNWRRNHVVNYSVHLLHVISLSHLRTVIPGFWLFLPSWETYKRMVSKMSHISNTVMNIEITTDT